LNPAQQQALEAMRRDARSALGSAQAVTARIEELLGGPPASNTYKRKAEREAKYAQLVEAGNGLVAALEVILRDRVPFVQDAAAVAAIKEWLRVLE
jgi:hypothetical protein